MAEAQADTFLSDVHVGTFSPVSDQGTVVSRYAFTLVLPHHCETSQLDPPAVELDKDGDIVVERKTQHVLFIEHAMSTTLEAVGLQVWRGALLMADYLLHSHRLHCSVVLELGAGTGLVSSIAALKAHHVFCTDTGQKVLELCQRNIDGSVSDMECCGSIAVRELNWLHPFSTAPPGFSWSQKDMEAVANVSFILASDVVYDNALTDALFSCLVRLHSEISRTPTIIISLEKRVIFSLEDLAAANPYYKHFRECLDMSYFTSEVELKFQAQQINTDFPQYSNYDKVKELELWELKAIIRNRSKT